MTSLRSCASKESTSRSSTCASNAGENSRPITAPTWAIRFAGPRWSRRLFKLACSVVGSPPSICPVEPGAKAVARVSRTAFVSSARNRGMPSPRSAIWRIVVSSSAPSAMPRTKAALSSPSNRTMLIAPTWAPTNQRFANGWREVTTSRIGELASRSMPSRMICSVVGSLHWMSSTSTSRGWRAASCGRIPTMASMICLRRAVGGCRSVQPGEVGRPRSWAKTSGVSASPGNRGRRNVSSFLRCAGGGSLPCNPSMRVRCCRIG